MTRAEFETWIEKHHRELFAVARRRSRSDEEASDAVQDAVIAMLSRPEFQQRAVADTWPWAVLVVRERLKDRRIGEQRKQRVIEEQTIFERAALPLGRKHPAPNAE